ncbi:hypothetical protein [Novipirellula sp.]|uniref:hypothetical protein n=1 Tax=Novipirellula sp. TaxID=2795430 RepID=UPI00356872FC
MMCELCEVDYAYNEHHLIPRHCHRKTWWKRRFTKEQMQQTISVCKMCHRSIHNLIPDEKVIGRHYHSIETLKSHPAIANYLAWKRRRLRE